MRKYNITRTSRFRREYKMMKKQGKDLRLLQTAIALLEQGEPLPRVYEDHALNGNWKGYRECHVDPDWLLIYKIYEDQLILSLERTGSHSYLFKK